MLVLDAGNALFKAPGMTDGDSKRRAELIVRAMGEVGTFAMAAGERDLNLGVDFLRTAAEKANVKVLSANLSVAGKRPFPASAVAQVGGAKVGVIGAIRPGDFGHGVTAGPVVASVVEEAKKLKGVDAVVVLAAVPYADALQLANEAKGAIDLVINSHEAKGPTPAQKNEWTYVVSGGERGRMVGKLVLNLAGKGPFLDESELEREQQLAAMLDRQISTLDQRLSATKDPAAKRDLEAARAQMLASKKEHEQASTPTRLKGARTLKLDWLFLGPDVAGDRALEAEVHKLEPPRDAH